MRTDMTAEIIDPCPSSYIVWVTVCASYIFARVLYDVVATIVKEYSYVYPRESPMSLQSNNTSKILSPNRNVSAIHRKSYNRIVHQILNKHPQSNKKLKQLGFRGVTIVGNTIVIRGEISTIYPRAALHRILCEYHNRDRN